MTLPYSATESQIQGDCLDWLAWHQILAFRVNSGQVLVANRNGSPRMIKLAPPGTADIIGMLPGGRFLAVECKTRKGKQTPEQEEFEQRVLANGGVYVLARSSEDLEKALMEEGIKGLRIL